MSQKVRREEQISILGNKESMQEERIQALFQLMNIADEESLRAIYSSLREDPCEIVRHEAAFVLGETASREACEELMRAVKSDSSLIVRHEALLALGTIANKDIIPFLEEQQNSSESLISESAKIALQRINHFPNPYRGPDEFIHLNKK